MDGEYLGASIQYFSTFKEVKILWYNDTSENKKAMEFTAVFSSEIGKGAKAVFRSGRSTRTRTQYWKEITISDKDGKVLEELKKYGFKN